ncbi:MAG: S-layer homology domain-containing protein, partial [Thermoleophilia bacterium]|nr:S-layer homology domain-containing protein [Thermoleophilia bacterium]
MMDRSHGRRGQEKRTARRLICIAVLALLFLSAMSGFAFADVWTDISDATWQSVYHVSAADAFTVAEGYPDGTFRPSQSVTRGQFAKMVADGLDIPLLDPPIPTFTDVPRDYIFYKYIEGAVAAGVISGYPDGTFRPENNILRQQTNNILGSWLAQEETATIGGIQGADGFYSSLAAWFAAEGQAVLSQFADGLQVSPVHRPATAYLVMRGVVLGSSSGGALYLKPLSELSRVQAVTMVLRTRDVVFEADIPTVTNVNPAAGPTAGGNSVVITGTGFGGLSGASAVRFGTVNATSYVVNSVTQVTAVAPAGTAGTTVDVTVTTPAGTSAVSAAGKYSYGIPTVTLLAPPAGPPAGGTSVVITGTGFAGLSGAAAVKFGTVNATSYVVNSATQITALAPAGTLGTTVDVTVTTAAGTSAVSAASKYSYGPPATAPSAIVLALGATNPVGAVVNVAIPAAGATDNTGKVT